MESILIAVNSRDTLFLKSDEFTQADRSLFTRHALRTAGLKKHNYSHVDRLIKVMENKPIDWTIAACHYITWEEIDTADERLLLILDRYSTIGTDVLYMDILNRFIGQFGITKRWQQSDLLDTFSKTPGSLWIVLWEQHRTIASNCFYVMEALRRFDADDLPTVFHPDDPTSQYRTKTIDLIPDSLRYVCCNWARHASVVLYHIESEEATQWFLRARIVQWVKVMNLIGMSPLLALRPLEIASVS